MIKEQTILAMIQLDPIYGDIWLSVAAGDGIQSVEANDPIPNPATPGTLVPPTYLIRMLGMQIRWL
jgi:hypothetical protein